MNAVVLSFKHFWGDVAPSINDARGVLAVAIGISVLSAFLAVLIGPIVLAVPGLIVLSYFVLRNRIFLLCFFLFSTLVVMYAMFRVYIVYSILLAVLTIFMWAARHMLRQAQPSKISWTLIVFSIFFIFITFLSDLNEGITGPELKTLIRFVIFFSLVYAIYDLFRPRDIFPVMISISIPLVVAAGYLIFVYSHARGLMGLIDLYRLKPGGIFPNTNVLGGVLMVILPFWLALSLWHRSRLVKLSSGLLALVMLTGLVLTNSRAAMVGFFIMSILFAVWAKKLRYLLGILGFLIVVFLAVPSVRLIISLGLRFDRGSSARTEVWKNTAKMITDNFWLGVGPGNFPRAYDKYQEMSIKRLFFPQMPNAHNLALNLPAEWGFMGFLILILLYCLPLRAGAISLKRMASVPDRGVIYGVIGGIVALYGWSFFEGGGVLGDGRPFPDILFWLLFAILLKVGQVVEKPSAGVFFDTNYHVSQSPANLV